MSYVSNPAPPDRSRRWLRFIFPAIVILLCGGAFAYAFVATSLGLDTDDTIGWYFAMLWLPPPLGVLLLGVWWLFFSGFRWRVRLIPVGVVAVLIAAWVGAAMSGHPPLRMELTTQNGRMEPVLHFAWERTALQRFEEYQQQQPQGTELPAIDSTVGPEDFARYRGAKCDGIVSHLKLQTDWATYPPKELWRHPCVGGYSGVAVAGNIVVTLEQRGHQETIVCYDRATGRQRWTYGYDAFRKDAFGDGPRATPTIHDGLIFTLGATGQLMCVDAQGKYQWGKEILRDSKAKNIEWGISGSPLIVNDLVIAHAGVDPAAPFDAALVAYDYKTGTKRWARGNRKAGYSSPQLAKLDGVTQILLFDGEALAGFDPKDGRELWTFPFPMDMNMNMMQPVVIGDDRVFISAEPKKPGSVLLRVSAPKKDETAWSVEPVWHNKNFGARFNNPVSDGKHIFGLHGIRGFLKCLDVAQGSVKWEGAEYGPGQMLLVDDVLLIVDDKGEAFLLDPAAPQEKVLARHAILDGKTWNTPALAGDQIFVRNQKEIACFKLPRR